MFKNKTIFITGASRGIGKAIGKRLAQEGANIIVTGKSSEPHPKLEGTIHTSVLEMEKAGGNALAIEMDVRFEEQVKSAIEKAVQTFGGIDVLINNAGTIDPIQRIEDSDPILWGRLIDINLKGLYYGIRYALPFMKSNNGGTILNVGSGAASTPLEGWSHYCSSKAAVHHLTSCLHKEEMRNGIRALTLSPGTVATGMQKSIALSGINSVSEIPWENHIPAHWPAMALAWMATSDSDEWLGQTVSLRSNDIRKRIGIE